MSIKKIALGLALTLGTLAPAHAATFKVAFDASSTGVGDDWFGTFHAPKAGGLLTSFTATINGTVFDTMFFYAYTPSIGGHLYPLFDATKNAVLGQNSSSTTFTPDPKGSVTQPALLMGVIGPNRAWGVGTCASSGACSANVQGSYTISAVPVPAALPLLATGLGALGFVARRRKQKTA